MLSPRGLFGASAITLLFTFLIHPVLGQASPDASGNWIVTGQEAISDITQVWNGNITVKSGGALTISNAVLIFNSTSNQSHQGIAVEEGGRIKMNGVRLTSVNESNGLTFIANGSVEIRNCRIDNIFGTTYGLRWIAGFRIMSDNPVVEGTVFSDGVGFGPRFEGCNNVVFKDNTVTRSSTGLLFEDSSGVLTGNLFYNNSDRQVVIRGCDGVEFRNNTVNISGMGGLIITRSKNVETSGNFYQGELYVVYISNRTTVTMTQETITGAQIHMELRGDSRATILDSNIVLNQTRTLEDSVITSSRTVRVRILLGEEPTPGAIVRVKDSERLLVAEATTGEDGIAELVLPQGTVATSATGETEIALADPYRFEAVKGIYSASGTADISVNPLVEMKLSLPWTFIIIGVVVVVAIVAIALSPPGAKRGSRKGRKA